MNISSKVEQIHKNMNASLKSQNGPGKEGDNEVNMLLHSYSKKRRICFLLQLLFMILRIFMFSIILLSSSFPKS